MTVHRAARLALAVGTVFGLMPTAAVAGPPPAAPLATPEERAAALVAQMTLDEKISQVHTTGNGAGGVPRLVPGIPRLGIPDLGITNGPAGVGTGSVPTQPNATALPAPVALAATFDPELARQYGVVQGRETANVGHNLLEAPDVNIVRVPQAGRAFENYGEDPYLAGQVAVANIGGVQSQGVMAEVKHYAANDQETNRRTINEVIDDRTLHEIHLPAFEDAVTRANVATVMCAYNAVNGEFMCENKHLLTDVLRGQWGFRGFVQSDASATHTAVGAAEAGQDLELRDNGPYDEELRQAVVDGRVSTQALDAMIVRRLATEIRFGLFDHPPTTSPIDAAAGGTVARTVAEQGTVLLKNADGALPLAAAALHSVAVVGPFAQTVHPGGGGSSRVRPLYTVSPVEGIQRRVGPGVSVTSSDGADTAQAAQLAAAADVAVVIVGDVEREGADRPNMSLTGNQNQLVAAVAAANPHTVVVVDSGAPVLMPWVDSVPAVVEAWYPGEEDGNALASVLFGDVNPAGKLPVTFPRTEDQTPISAPERWPGVAGVAQYSEGLQVGYRWYDAQGQDPLFPFGFGLSYTNFSFSHLTVSPVLLPGGHVTVGVDVTNTGTRAGAEVVQLYVADPAAAGEPPHQLKSFDKVDLAPGQTEHVTFQLDERAFSVWDSAAQQWTTVDGRYQLAVGNSSRNLPLTGTVTVPLTVGTQSIAVAGPQTVPGGSSATVTTTFTNTGDLPVLAVNVGLRGPAGWTVAARSPASSPFVAPHSTVRTTWDVGVPGPPGAATLTATATYLGVRSHATVTGTASVNVS
ncbi:MAG: beta-glucosidase [Micromonosporaceae bacterium]|jgi:beta-glucosidase|nr:beta-glucosidase [Micromonosporaceae bacterium]